VVCGSTDLNQTSFPSCADELFLHRQLLLADVYPEGLRHPDCLLLAQQHSTCVDAAKSGTFVYADEIPPPSKERGWPDFLADHSDYRSPKALGQLYRAIDEDLLVNPPSSSLSSLVDPHRTLTAALSNLPLTGLPSPPLLRPSATTLSHFRRLLASFSSELAKIADLSLLPRSGPGGPARTLSEVELFLGVTLGAGAKRLDKSDKMAQSRRREQTGELFSLVRRLIRDGEGGERRASPALAVSNAWAAWLAAVEEGEDRGKAAKRSKKGGKESMASTFGWLALGVLVEELKRLEKEQVEVLVLD
jgi:hypothetical protein